jgi:hypothetical protein
MITEDRLPFLHDLSESDKTPQWVTANSATLQNEIRSLVSFFTRREKVDVTEEFVLFGVEFEVCNPKYLTILADIQKIMCHRFLLPSWDEYSHEQLYLNVKDLEADIDNVAGNLSIIAEAIASKQNVIDHLFGELHLLRVEQGRLEATLKNLIETSLDGVDLVFVA